MGRQSVGFTLHYLSYEPTSVIETCKKYRIWIKVNGNENNVHRQFGRGVLSQKWWSSRARSFCILLFKHLFPSWLIVVKAHQGTHITKNFLKIIWSFIKDYMKDSLLTFPRRRKEQ